MITQLDLVKGQGLLRREFKLKMNLILPQESVFTGLWKSITSLGTGKAKINLFLRLSPSQSQPFL